MYNDGGVTDNLWTGQYDAVEGMYEYPDAHQNLIVRFPTWYLSADDGDFTTDSVTITSEVCASEDITIGNAPAQVFSATMLNPDGLMENCTWGDGAVYLGVVTAEASADTHSGWVCCVSYNTHEYGFTANGTAYYDSTSQAIGGEPKAIVVKQDGTAEYYTSTGAYKYDGSFASITPDAFLAAKYGNYDEPLGIILDTNACPSIINNVAAGTKVTTTYIPMGIFDFSNVDAFGITFNVEAYDGMVKFDADATAWVEALDFTTPLTLSDLITAISTQVGFTPIVSGYAVNTSLSFSENPITNYASTYRQVLKWLAEAIGCNVRVSRTGQLVFWVFGSSVATITPDTIISNTRTKNRYTIPQMTRVVCYNTVGAGYEDGVSGPPYYIIANPFIDPSAGMTPVTNLLSIVGNIPTYYPTTISVACADPRIDVGEYITVNATDGTSYVMPIMRQTLSWNGMCKATYIATGNQTRDIPAAMTGNDLSSVVNSNPAAVVNKIMAKGITVYDSSNNVLFSAIGDDHTVEIAGFTVQNGKLVYENSSGKITMGTVLGFTSMNKNTQHSAYLDDGKVSVSDNSTDENPMGTLDPEQLTFRALVNYKTAEYRRDGLALWQNGLGDASLDLTNGLHIDDNTNDVDVKPTGISITNGTATTTTSTNGITFDDGTTSPQFKIIQRVLTSAGTLTFSLSDGIYLCIVTRNNSNDSAQTGFYILQVRSSGSSSCLTIASANNTTLSVSGGTLTWTTTTPYKTLTILRITG